jgi:uncharacterized membrane protein YkoI
MRRSKLMSITLIAAIAAGSAGAAVAAGGDREHGEQKEITAVLGAKTPLAQAIKNAETKTGARAIRIEIEKRKGAYFYEVRTISKDKVAKAYIDPASGQVVKTTDEGVPAMLYSREDRDEFAKFLAAPTTLSSAIATAEQLNGGKAVEAGYENENGTVLCEVKIAKGKVMHKVRIDGTSGKILKVRARVHEEHEED